MIAQGSAVWAALRCTEFILTVSLVGVATAGSLGFFGGACRHRMSAELRPQRSQNLCLERVLLTRAKPREKRFGDDRRGHIVLHRRLNRPAAFAGVLDESLNCGKIGICGEG